MSLNILKQRLQEALNESTESEDFKEALEDAIYGCNLSEAAIDTLLFCWSSEEIHLEKLSIEDGSYQKGVQFVADIWNGLNSSN